MKEDNAPLALTIDEIKANAAQVAEQMKRAGAGPLPPELRARFIDVRAALFQRGIYDPVLVRFDSATVSQASVAEIADQLASVAAAL
jgi:hypothetical protein